MNIFKKNICAYLVILISLIICLPNNTSALMAPKTDKANVSENLVGSWKMQTIVTKSNCPYVIVGSTTESDLEIQIALKNILKTLWKGGNWTNSIGTIKPLNEREAITERITEFKTNDNNTWKAILIDHLKLEEDNIMHLESIVIQYKNGIKVGEYETFSILTKNE